MLRPTHPNKEESKILLKIATTVVKARCLIFIIQFISSSFDFSTDAFRGVRHVSNSRVDSLALRIFRGFSQWDAVHFLVIAEHGYYLEQSLAFFPLFPYLSYLIATAWSPIFVNFGILSTRSAVLMTGVGISNILSVGTSLVLYRIALKVTKCERTALISALLFSLNPASVFFSSFYTESTYSFFSFVGIYMLICDDVTSIFSTFVVTLVFACSFLTRSNGFVNIGYILFYNALDVLFDCRRGQLKRVGMRNLLLASARITLSVVGVILPLRLYSILQSRAFCSPSLSPPPLLLQFARSHNMTISGDSMSWCNVKTFLLPPFYSEVQRKYWDVSFLGYWQMRKLPLFLMASPAIYFTVISVLNVFRRTLLDLDEAVRGGKPVKMLISHGDSLPFALHSAFLLIGALTVYNVEVFTRIVFSSTPLLYIELSRIIAQRTPKMLASDTVHPRGFPFFPYLMQRRDVTLWVGVYFTTYALVGTALHASALPFT